MPADDTRPRPWSLGRIARLVGMPVALVLSKIKIILTVGAMLLTLGLYALLFGPLFGLGFMLLLAIHEYGHVLQARREGLQPSLPYFIPFFGAAVIIKDLNSKTALTEARIGLAGPIVGSLASLVPLGIYLVNQRPIFLALACTGFVLNLFNLLPVVPLDGGRAMAAVSVWLWLPGIALLIGVAVWLRSPLVGLIVILALLEASLRLEDRDSEEHQRYHQITTKNKLAVLATYLGLTIALLAGVSLTYRPAQELKQQVALVQPPTLQDR